MPSPNAINHLASARAFLGFNGQPHEAITGWQLLGNGYRAYNPLLSRFHSPDALSPFEKGGINAYAYCGNEPTNREDPGGAHFAYVVGAAALLAVGGGLAVGATLVRDKETKIALAALAGVAFAAGAALSLVAGNYIRDVTQTALDRRLAARAASGRARGGRNRSPPPSKPFKAEKWDDLPPPYPWSEQQKKSARAATTAGTKPQKTETDFGTAGTAHVEQASRRVVLPVAGDRPGLFHLSTSLSGIQGVSRSNASSVNASDPLSRSRIVGIRNPNASAGRPHSPESQTITW